MMKKRKEGQKVDCGQIVKGKHRVMGGNVAEGHSGGSGKDGSGEEQRAHEQKSVNVASLR